MTKNYPTLFLVYKTLCYHRSFTLLTVVILVGLLVGACAPALPTQDPEAVVATSAETALQASARAEALHQEIVRERERMERLFSEAERLAREAQSAQAKCEASLAEYKRSERVRAERARQAAAAARARRVIEETPDEPTPKQWPEFSPSDAPIDVKKPATVP